MLHTDMRDGGRMERREREEREKKREEGEERCYNTIMSAIFMQMQQQKFPNNARHDERRTFVLPVNKMPCVTVKLLRTTTAKTGIRQQQQKHMCWQMVNASTMREGMVGVWGKVGGGEKEERRREQRQRENECVKGESSVGVLPAPNCPGEGRVCKKHVQARHHHTG